MDLRLPIPIAVFALLISSPAIADYEFDYSAISKDYIGFGSGSSKLGIPLWSPELNDYTGGFLGNIDNLEWRDDPMEWIPGTTTVVWGGQSGLFVWDTQKNSNLGQFNNVKSTGWNVAGIALHPADKTKVIFTSKTGLRVWDTVADKDVGVFNNATGDWSSNEIANHPTNPDYIVFIGSGRLRVWDTVLNVLVGPYGTDAGPIWGSGSSITLAPARVQRLVIPLEIELKGNRITLSWEAEIGATYKIQNGTQLWDFRDKTSEFVATETPVVKSFAISGGLQEYFRVCRVSEPSE